MKIMRFKQVLSLMLCALLLFGIMPAGIITQVAADALDDESLVITNCDSLTGWTKVNDDSYPLSVVDGAIQSATAHGFFQAYYELPDAMDLSDYNAIEWDVGYTGANGIEELLNAYKELGYVRFFSGDSDPTDTMSYSLIFRFDKLTITKTGENWAHIKATLANATQTNRFDVSDLTALRFYTSESTSVDTVANGTIHLDNFKATYTAAVTARLPEELVYHTFNVDSVPANFGTSTAGVNMGTPLATGVGDNTAYIYRRQNTNNMTGVVQQGALALTAAAGNTFSMTIRPTTSLPIMSYRTLIVRMKKATGHEPGDVSVRINDSAVAATISAADITDEYKDFTLELSAEDFANYSNLYNTANTSNGFDRSTLSFRFTPSATATVYIDKIYFTDPLFDDYFVYNDFDHGLGADSGHRTDTGNSAGTVAYAQAEGGLNNSRWRAENGVLHLELTQGNSMRFITANAGGSTYNLGLDKYNFMVLYMKGSAYNTLTETQITSGANLSLYFGNNSSNCVLDPIPIEALMDDNASDDYKQITLEIPDSTTFYDALGANTNIYKSALVILSNEANVRFEIDINAIYFTNFIDVIPDQDVEPPTAVTWAEADTTDVDPDHNYIYNNFDAGLGADKAHATSTGNGTYTAYVLQNQTTLNWNPTVGALRIWQKDNDDDDGYRWLRTYNTIKGLHGNFRYLVLRLKGDTGALDANDDALALKFGTVDDQSVTPLTVKAGEISRSSGYHYVTIDITEKTTYDNLYPLAAGNYAYGMWIGSKADDLYIDTIFFTNTRPETQEDSDGTFNFEDDPTELPTEFVYHNFNAGLGVDEESMLPTGNGTYAGCDMPDQTTANWNVMDGKLVLENMDNGQWLRTQNTIRGLSGNFNYMVLHMKGWIDGETPDKNAGVIALKFGSNGTQSAERHITAGLVTDYYSDVYVEIPDNYYAAGAGKYVYGLWIGSKINGLALYIDYIYFTNEAPPEEDDTPEPAFEADHIVEKYTYNDFEDGLGDSFENHSATGNGMHTAHAIDISLDANTPEVDWDTEDGVLTIEKNAEAGTDVNGFQWLRTSNTITGLEDYHYMYLRIKGTSSTSTERLLAFKFGSQGNANQTKTLYVASSALLGETDEDGYTYIQIPIQNPKTYYAAVPEDPGVTVTEYTTNLLGERVSTEYPIGYRYGLWIGVNVDDRTVDLEIDEIFFSNNATFADDLAGYKLPDPLVYAQYTDSEGEAYNPALFPKTYTEQREVINNALTIDFDTGYYGSVRYNIDQWATYSEEENEEEFFTDASAADRNLHTKYAYMVLELEGGNALDYTTDSSLFQITFGGWDNSSVHPIVIKAEDIVPTRYNTLVLALDDAMFEQIGRDGLMNRNQFKNDVIIQQATTSNNLKLEIQKIYFTNNLPDGFDYASVNRDVMNGGQPVDICDLVKLQLNINKGEALPAHEISISDMDKNRNVNAADADYMHKLLLGLYTENYSGFVYADFTNVFSPNVFTEGNNPTALNADGTLTRLASGTDSDTRWENTPGVFNVTVKQSGIRLRNDTFLEGFYNPNFYSNGAYQYTYMRIVLKGSAYDSDDTVLTDPNQNLFEIYFGNSANSVNSQNVKISQIAPYDGDTYTTLVFTLTNMFYNNAGRPEWLDALNIVLADDFSKLKLSIDEITLY